MKDRYTSEEVDAILRRAIDRAPLPGEMSREQLVKLAAEVGVGERELELAEKDYLTEDRNRAFFSEFVRERRSGFNAHLMSYVGVIGFLFLLNMLTSSHELWFVFPALGWGLGLFFHGAASLGTSGLENSEEYAKWLLERRIREETLRLGTGRRPLGPPS